MAGDHKREKGKGRARSRSSEEEDAEESVMGGDTNMTEGDEVSEGSPEPPKKRTKRIHRDPQKSTAQEVAEESQSGSRKRKKGGSKVAWFLKSAGASVSSAELSRSPARIGEITDYTEDFLNTLTFSGKLLLQLLGPEGLKPANKRLYERFKEETGQTINADQVKGARRNIDGAFGTFNQAPEDRWAHTLAEAIANVPQSRRDQRIIATLSGEEKLLVQLFEVEGLTAEDAWTRWSEYAFVGRRFQDDLASPELRERYNVLLRRLGPVDAPSSSPQVASNMPTRLSELDIPDQGLNLLNAVDRLILQIDKLERPEAGWTVTASNAAFRQRTGIQLSTSGYSSRNRRLGTTVKALAKALENPRREPRSAAKPQIFGKEKRNRNRRALLELPLHSHQDLVDFARQRRRQLLVEYENQLTQGVDRSDIVEPSFEREYNYFQIPAYDIRSLLRTHAGLGHESRTVDGVTLHTDIRRARNFLQLVDANDGIEPEPNPGDSNRYGGLRVTELRNLARARGLTGVDIASKTELVAYLLNTDENPPGDLLSPEAVADALLAATPYLLDEWARLRGIPISSIGNSGSIMRTHNSGLIAPQDVLQRLEDIISREIRPAATSNSGLMCGLRGLLNTLHTMMNVDREAGEYADPLRLEEVLSRMYQNFAPTNSADTPAGFTNFWEGDLNEDPYYTRPNFRGNPTQGYAEFLRRRLTGFGLIEGTSSWNEEWTEMTTMNNFNSQQLQMVLDFLREEGLTDREYALGVVTGATTTQPARAQIVGTNSMDVPVLWLHNDNAQNDLGLGGTVLNHWQGFEQDGTERTLVLSWGMHILFNADEVDLALPGRDDELSTMLTEEQRAATLAALLKKREREKRTSAAYLAAKKRMATCFHCRDTNQKCDGWVERTCTPCTNDQTACEFEPHLLPEARLYKASEITEAQLRKWDVPLRNWDEAMKAAEDARILPLPTPETKHFLVFPCLRMSSAVEYDPAYFQSLVAQVPLMVQRYDNMLNSGLIQAPEGVRPGGAGTYLQHLGIVLVRHGTRHVPCQPTNGLANPYLLAFVNHIHHVTAAANANRPIRIQFLTMGLAGFAVGISAFGSRIGGFFKFILDQDALNHTNLADAIDIVSVVEPRLVTGNFDHSLHGLGNAVPYFQGHQGKYLLTNPLSALIDRYAVQLHHAQQNNLRAQMNLAPNLLPTPPGSQRLDLHLRALQDEEDWRANCASATFPPTTTQIAGRNTGRNRRWNP